MRYTAITARRGERGDSEGSERREVGGGQSLMGNVVVVVVVGIRGESGER